MPAPALPSPTTSPRQNVSAVRQLCALVQVPGAGLAFFAFKAMNLMQALDRQVRPLLEAVDDILNPVDNRGAGVVVPDSLVETTGYLR
jgi:hypothetical protein